MKRLWVTYLIYILFTGCADYTNNDQTKAFRKPTNVESTINSVTELVVVPRVNEFETEAKTFTSLLIDYCKNSLSKKNQIDLAWKKLILSFHKIEAIPFGPILEDDGTFFKELYSYPDLNKCIIDRLVIKKSNSEAIPERLPYNAQGLMALEYLLMDGELKTSCPSNSPELQEWDAKSVTEKKNDRCALAENLIARINKKAENLKKQWQPENYPTTLKNSSETSIALKPIIEALLEMENLKDIKIGRPLGLHMSCAQDSCPESLEHPWSDLALESIYVSLQSYYDLFDAKGGFGLDEYLISRGYSELVEKYKLSILKSIEHTKHILGKTTFKKALTNNPKPCRNDDSNNELCKLHETINQSTTILKTEILTVFSIEQTVPTPGDNDGV